jgi:hypothetical protein
MTEVLGRWGGAEHGCGGGGPDDGDDHDEKPQMTCGFGFAPYRRQVISLWPPEINWCIMHLALTGWMAGGKSERVSAWKQICRVAMEWMFMRMLWPADWCPMTLPCWTGLTNDGRL